MLFEEYQISASGYETIAVSSAVKSLTTTKILPTSGNFSGRHAVRAMLQVIDDDIWYTVDGTTPSASNGHKLQTTDSPIIIVGPYNLKNFQAIRVTTDASLRVTYYHPWVAT